MRRSVGYCVLSVNSMLACLATLTRVTKPLTNTYQLPNLQTAGTNDMGRGVDRSGSESGT